MDLILNNLPVVWLIIAVILLIIEAITVGLVTIWFAGGALVTIFIAFLTDSFIIQFISFVLISTLLLVFTRPLLNKYFEKDKIKTNVDSLIGEQGIIISASNKLDSAQAKIKSQIWTVIEKNGKKLEKDTKINVLSIEGVKLIVEKKEEEKC